MIRAFINAKARIQSALGDRFHDGERGSLPMPVHTEYAIMAALALVAYFFH